MKLSFKYWGLIMVMGVAFNSYAQDKFLSNVEGFRQEMEVLSEEGNLDSIYSICTRLVENKLNRKLKGWVRYHLAETYHQNGQIDSAEFYLNEAINHFENANQTNGIALSLNLVGLFAFSEQQYEQAREAYNRALKIATKFKHPEIAYKVSRNKAILHSSTGSNKLSLKDLQNSLFTAYHLDDKEKIKDTYLQLSTNYYSIGQLDSAIFYLDTLINFKKSIQEKHDLLSDFSMLGKLYNEKAAYVEAQAVLIDALRLAEQVKDTFFMMSLYTDIAQTNAAQHLWKSTIENAQQAIALAQIKQVRLIEAKNLEIQALAYHEQQLQDQAIELYLKALSIYESLNNAIGVADVFLKIGQLHQRNNDYQEAFQYVKQAIDTQKENGNVIGVINAQLLLGELYLQIDQFKEAIPILSDCLARSKTINHTNSERRTLELLSQAYANKKEYQKAYQLYQQFTRLEDSLSSIATARMINEMEVKYKTEIKDNELKAQDITLNLKESQINQQKFQLITVGIILTLTLLLLGVLYYIYLKNKQLNRQRIETLKKEKEAQRLRAIIEGEEKERKRIARDLHDDLGALLATVKIRINALENDIPGLRKIPNYGQTEDLIDDACRTVREISHNMAPSVLEQLGLEQAISNRCEIINNTHNLNVDFIPHGLDQGLDSSVQVSIYRIVQELLRNVIKHAKAKEVIVQLTVEDDNINLIVEDDGIGFNLDKIGNNRGLGLESITSRVKYFEGTIDIDSQIGQGTTFTIDLPIPKISNLHSS